MSLDAQVYPHIWDRVRSHAPPELLLRLRLVDRAASAEATRTLFEHVVITRASALELRSARGCRLPVPPFDDKAYHPKLPPGPWELTRVLDLATSVRGLDEQPFPALRCVRRRVWSEDAPPSHTCVDVVRLPAPRGTEAFMDNVSEETRRHVTVVRYCPTTPALAEDSVMNIDMLEEGVDGVFVFLPCPSDGKAWARRRWDDDIPDYETGSDGPSFHSEDEFDSEAEDEGDGEDEADGSGSDVGDTPVSGSAHRTFLNNFLWCAAQRIHKEYTFVGLESVPTHLIAQELKRDPAEVAARAAEPGWATYLSDAVVEGIRAIPRDPGWEEGVVDERDVADVVEVLTMDAFRAQVGEQQWALETFADLD
jgi:hypothetical protein